MEKSSLEDIKTKIHSDIMKHDKKSDYETELNALRLLARNIFLTLGVIIAIAGFVLGFKDELSIQLVWGCITAGVLGSTSSALISALQRKANGWETEDGKKHPIDGKKEMFSQRMATFFLLRPTFGIIGGLLIYFGMQSKYFGDTGIEDPSKVIFWSLLSGLFVKSLLEKLKDLFDSLVGKK
jgi:hypothetical protein